MKQSLILFLVLFVATTSEAQDFRKVVEIVDEMDTSLRKMIRQEQADRKAEVAALRREIDQLRSSGTVSDAATKTTPGTEAVGDLGDVRQRLENVEKKIDQTQANLVQLTKALSVLVGELKKTAQDPKPSSHGQP